MNLPMNCLRFRNLVLLFSQQWCEKNRSVSDWPPEEDSEQHTSTTTAVPPRSTEWLPCMKIHIYTYTYSHADASASIARPPKHTHTPFRSGLTVCLSWEVLHSLCFYHNPVKTSSWITYIRKQSQRPWRNMLNVMNCLSSWWTVCNRKIGPFTRRNHSKQWNNGTILLLRRCHLSIILQVLWLTGLQTWELWIAYLLF